MSEKVKPLGMITSFEDWLAMQACPGAEAWKLAAERVYETMLGAKLMLDALGATYTAADVLLLNDHLVQSIAQAKRYLAHGEECPGKDVAEVVASVLNALNARSSKPAPDAGSEPAAPAPEVSG